MSDLELARRYRKWACDARQHKKFGDGAKYDSMADKLEGRKTVPDPPADGPTAPIPREEQNRLIIEHALELGMVWPDGSEP